MATFLPFNKNILTPIGEPFERRMYGEKGLIDPLPKVLGSGILGDVAGKGPRTQRGLKCPTGTQPNASNTACIPIKKTTTTAPITTTPITTTKTGLTCAQRGLVDDGMGGCKSEVGTTTNGGCIYGKDQYGNCIDPTGSPKSLFDERYKDKPYVTTADIGIVRQDPRTGQTITDTGISMADALKNYGLTPEESYRVTYSPYGAEERGQGAARGTWETPEDYNNRRLLETFSPRTGFTPVQPWKETPALLSTEDFLAQYSRPSKTVEQGILGPDQEGAEARRIAEMQSEVYGVDNLFTPSPRARVTAGPTAAEIRNEESARQGKEQSQRQREARDKLAKIKDRQANEKEFKKADVAAKKAEKKATTAKKTASKAKAKAKSNPTPLNQKSAFMAQSNAQKATKSAVSKRNTAKEKKTKSIMGSTNYAAYTRRGRK